MKCPNCGTDMEEGALYCEKCGAEIHIVPDFEPEIEDAYRQTIDNITNDLWENETAAENQIEIPGKEEKEKEKKKEKRNKKENEKSDRKLFAVLVCGTLLFFAILTTGILLWMHNSAGYQINRARRASEAGDYLKASRHYERALKLADDVNIKIELAETYFYRNNKIEYEYLLWNIIRDPNATQEQIESAYGKLIAVYRSREDYQGINDFLLESGNDKVMSAYQMYLAKEPEFSVLEGEYNSVQPLKLTAGGEGTIYYTTDGSDPDEHSKIYAIPILLEEGSYQIKALFINANGIRSNIVEKNYVIEIEEIPEPSVNLASGKYTRPMLIIIEDDPENVYYTTDTREPDADSNLYTGAIPLPIGRSVFKFIRIEAGVSSNVGVYRYELNLNTDLTPQDAEKIVVDYSLESGKILDESGKANEEGSFYRYEYQYVRNINDEGDFFVIRESLDDKMNNKFRTGTYFAVDIYNGDLYRLNIDEFGYGLIFLKGATE